MQFELKSLEQAQSITQSEKATQICMNNQKTSEKSSQGMQGKQKSDYDPFEGTSQTLPHQEQYQATTQVTNSTCQSTSDNSPMQGMQRKKGEPKAAFLERLKNDKSQGSDDVYSSPASSEVIRQVNQDSRPLEGNSKEMQRKKGEPVVIYVTPAKNEEVTESNQDYDPLEGTCKIVDQQENNPSTKLEIPDSLFLSPMSLIDSNASSQINSNLSIPSGWKLNNQRFNPNLLAGKVLNISVLLAIVLIILVIFLYKPSVNVASIRINYSGFFGNIILCSFHPFILFICNKKLRNFILNHFRK